jgi:adenylosuccinate lyase
VASNIKVYDKVIRKHVLEELPFMATENIMMSAVKRGGNRQDLHERIRVHSIAAGKTVKEEGKQNDLIERIAADPIFGLTREEIDAQICPEAYTGRSASQVTELIRDYVKPILERYPDCISKEDTELKV